MTVRQSTWLGVGIAALLVLVIGALAVIGGASGGSGDGGDQGAYVKLACHDWVKDRLKSPSSAKFSGDTIKRTGNTYVVTGAVDSQNSFGAMIRNRYQCEAIHEGESSSLVALNGLDE